MNGRHIRIFWPGQSLSRLLCSDVTNGTGSSIAAVALRSPNKAFRLPRTNWSSEALLCLFTESTVPQCAASLSFDDKNCCLISRIFLTTFSFLWAQFLHIISVTLLPLCSFVSTDARLWLVGVRKKLATIIRVWNGLDTQNANRFLRFTGRCWPEK